MMTLLQKKCVVTPQATIAGSVQALQDTIGAYRELGVDEFIVPDFNLGDHPVETLDRLINEVFAPFH